MQLEFFRLHFQRRGHNYVVVIIVIIIRTLLERNELISCENRPKFCLWNDTIEICIIISGRITVRSITGILTTPVIITYHEYL